MSSRSLVLVTGGAGFIAATLQQQLLDRGHSVIAVDNMCRGSRANVAHLIDRPGFRLVEADISDYSAFRAAVDSAADGRPIGEVWHLAANSDIPAGVADPKIDFRDTFLTTFNTVLLMKERSIPDVYFASSSAIYGDLGDVALTENVGPLLPISNYGAMKLASEAQISAAAESFLKRALLFRFPNVVGVPATHGVILDFVRKLRSDAGTLPVLGDGTQQKAYLHVSDLVDAMLMLRDRAPDGVAPFNIGPVDEGVTVRWLAEQTVAAASPSARIVFGEGNRGWVGDVPRFRYSVDRLASFGWTPRLDSRGAVSRAIREVVLQELGR
jgi:UDP-glucose 4-epimerase